MNIEPTISLDTFLTSVSIGVIFTTGEGTITSTNLHLKKQFGYEEEDLLGEPITKLIPSLFYELSYHHKTIITDLKSEDTGINIDTSGIKKNGDFFLLEATLNYCKTPNEDSMILLIKEVANQHNSKINPKTPNIKLGKKMDEHTLKMAQNVRTLTKLISVTKEKDVKLRKTNNFLKNIWNYVEAIIFVTDSNGVIKLFNPTAEKKLGYHAHELVDSESLLLFFNKEELIERGKNLAKELNRRIIEDFSILTLPADLGLSNEFETRLIRKDKTNFPVSITLNRMGSQHMHSSLEGYIGIARDISEKKKVEIELINNLEKEKELSDLRFRLLSLASHEFKTPLNVILLSTSIISKYDKTKDHPKREKQLERISNCVNNLNDLLQDLLSISKLQKGMIQVKNAYFKPKEYIKEIIDELSVLLKKDQVVLYKHVGPNLLYLDAGMLKHIIVNLLSNAIKFSPESSKISLYSKKAGDVFLFSIKDNGCGISKEDQLNLFNRFYRGSNVSNIEGSGLGLYIIGNYLENMKGKLDFKSKLNIGTKVKLSFNTVGEESATFYNTPA